MNYLKFRNDIDEILNNIRFFDAPPTELMHMDC
jgi:hypothetical protein